jgi:hypothetical protein
MPLISYKEWLRVWTGNQPSDFGLKAIVDEVKSTDDVDDLDMFEVVDKQLFFLSALKYGFNYNVIGK